MKKLNKKSFLDRHPFLPSGLAIGYVLFGLTVPIIFIYFPGIGDEAPRFLHFVSFVLISAPITLTILQIIAFKRSIMNIRHLAILYLEIILMFGVIYFAEVSSRTKADIQSIIQTNDRMPAIRGINADWIDILIKKENTDKTTHLQKMLICFQDCIHFSLITSTTVGYGDMVPVRPLAKLLVDIQVLVSFFLISFGVASFTSSRHSRSEREEFNKLSRRVRSLEDK